MNLQAGYPYSLIKHGLLFNYPQLNKNLETDVLVVGGGISGALVAWHLIKRGIGCVLADSRTIGLGSTCASTGLLQYEIDTALSELKDIVGLKQAVRAYHLCRQAIYELGDISKEIGFNEFEYKRSLYYAAHKKDISFLRDEFTIRKESGFDIEYLSAAALKKEVGFNAPAALLSNDGAQVDAYLFSHRLLQHAIKQGLLVFDRTKIMNLGYQNKNNIFKTEDKFTIKAKRIVYATGYESVKYVSKSIVKLLSTFATVSEHMDDDSRVHKNDLMIWNTANPYLYMRTTHDGRILIGGRDENFYNPLKRDKMIKRKAVQLAEDFKTLFPAVDFKPEFSWAGTFGATKDGLPFIGNYKPIRNGYFALGFGGNGITFSQVAATIIADLIEGKNNSDARLFSFDRV